MKVAASTISALAALLLVSTALSATADLDLVTFPQESTAYTAV